MKTTQTTGLALLAPLSQAYVWPSKYDGLDDLLYLQDGFIKQRTLSDRALSVLFYNTDSYHDRGLDL